MGDAYEDSLDDKSLAYDLRQIYARIVGEHLVEVANHRKAKSYPGWFNALDNLFIEISQKLDEDEMKEYKELKTETIKLINENRQIYIGNSHDPKRVAIIVNALRDMDIWIKHMMEEHGMFGTRRYEEGL